jgi:hypothetical protein
MYTFTFEMVKWLAAKWWIWLAVLVAWAVFHGI